MTNYFVALLLIFGMFACKNKKKTTEDESIKANDLYSYYHPLKLPFAVTDSTMDDIADTSKISHDLFAQFVPDTALNNPFGKDRKLTIQPIGKIEVKGKETYLVTLVSSKNLSAVYLFVFNNKKFSTGMPIITNSNDDVRDAASIDKKLSIVINKEWNIKNEVLYKRTIYAYNNVGIFTTILTETNEARSTTEKGISNPLDTFPKRNKYSGDYIKGTKSIVSIRDGKGPAQYLFFVHFENDNEDEACGGELRGRFEMVSEKKGVFTQNGDPCVLDFTFSSNEVQVKENGSCGNNRGIKCFFNDTYTKKKESKPAKKRSKQ